MKRAVLFVVLAIAACSADGNTLPPYGQIVLYIDTDAPLPPPAGETAAPTDPPALFDRVRIEVYRPHERAPCVDCTHEFALDRKLVGDGQASVGITPPVGATGHVARIRLFRSAFVFSGEPPPDATVEVTIALPPISEEGIVPVTVLLPTSDVGTARGTLDAPLPATVGSLAGGHAGTWAGAHYVPCAAPPRAGEACIPGGAFWMGHPRLRAFRPPGDELVFRIAVLDPFYLDLTEVTVDAFRAGNGAVDGDPMRYSPADSNLEPALHCTYTDEPGNDERLPVNCISWARARAFCNQRDGDLPTEAQHQYAASAREGRLYPWGEDRPACKDAVYTRAVNFFGPEERCPGAWVAPAGSGERDRLPMEGGVVVDLAGNVAEHALDLWNLPTESCWGRGVFENPVCTEPTKDPNGIGQHTVLGGSFITTPAELAAAHRYPGFSFARAQKLGPAGGPLYAPRMTSTGFRCARPAR